MLCPYVYFDGVKFRRELRCLSEVSRQMAERNKVQPFAKVDCTFYIIGRSVLRPYNFQSIRSFTR